MKARGVLAFAVAFVLAAAVLAHGASKTVIIPAGDLKWTPLDAKFPGVMIADLWGDHAKGAFGAIIKFPAGFATPLHSHTHDMKLVIVSGTVIHTPEGKPEIRLGPGSYIMQGGAGYKHTTACDKGSDCVFFGESNGAFDLKPAEAPAKK